MEVTGTSSYYRSSQNVSGTSDNLTSKDVFFKILAAELSNQDPLKGKDGTEYVGQLAQFTNLEQTQQMYSVMNQLLMSQSVTEAGMMIGKEVDFAVRDENGTYKTEKGIVESVKIEGGQVYLKTKDDKIYLLSQSIGIKEVENVKPEEPENKPEEPTTGDEVKEDNNKNTTVDNSDVV